MVERTMDRAARRRQQAVLQALLRDVRRERHLSQQEVADRVGMEQTAISKIELGEKRADLLELRDICEATGISLVDFIVRLEERLMNNA
jgi:transcriptional regulator with XRE-family HTH domain